MDIVDEAKEVIPWLDENSIVERLAKEVERLRQLNEEWRDAVLDLGGHVSRADWAMLVSDKTKAAYTKAAKGE